MRTLFKLVFAFSLVLVLIGVCSGVAMFHEFGSDPGFNVSINGDDLSFNSMDLGDWLGLGLGLGITALVMCIVLPLVLLLSVGLPLLVLCCVIGGLALAAGSVGAVLFSPLFFVVLLLWLLLRSPRRKSEPPARHYR
ncbi:hypothetical protein RQP53_12160 [Paucibacter sp. APW11]|uniref:DUF4064 domain-containing protein n=1 Tax=Roseateles aquae TaxID=3077235 RepID=A0ABU3PCK5_9BURK|nr:hypothetical protein [Paucibacter sp. APW11]MDT9000020.1 hypothetical protein [Paucibacter sp. APW11]